MNTFTQNLDLDGISEEGAGLSAFRRDLGDLTHLAASIKNDGLVSPPLVWQTNARDAPFVVLDGRRRLAAIRMLRTRSSADRVFALQQVPCVVKEMRLGDALNLVMRLRLDPAVCLQNNRGDEAKLCEEFRLREKMTEEGLEQYIGLSQSVISQSRKYLDDLPDGVLELMRTGAITKVDADNLLKAMKKGPMSANTVAAFLEPLVATHSTSKVQVTGARKRTAAIW